MEIIDKHRAKLAQAFIEQYNDATINNYSFECLRRSMFNSPQHYIAQAEIYQMSFAKKKGIRAFLNRLIIEVIKPNPNEPTLKDYGLARVVDIMLNEMEYRAASDVVCSKQLLIDCTEFGPRVEIMIKAFSQWRNQKKEMMESADKFHKLSSGLTRSPKEERKLAGLAPSLWFENIFFAYRNNSGELIITM